MKAEKQNLTNQNIRDFYNQMHEKATGSFLEKLKQSTRLRILRGIIKKKKGKFLVVGCGSRNELSIFVFKNKHKNVTAIDISSVAIKKQKRQFPQFKFLVADAQKLPFKNTSFDHIICSEVIEHLEKPTSFLKEAHRVLSPGGTLTITTPNKKSLFGLARQIGEYVLNRPLHADDQPIDRWTTKDSLVKKLKKHGFRVVLTTSCWFYPPTGKGKIKIPDIITLPIFLMFYPLELLFQLLRLSWGHTIIIVSRKKYD